MTVPLVNDEGAGTAPEDRAFRPDIEGLRAVAVLLVVFFHAGILHVIGGYVGVDVFFVISGFVITGVLLREQVSAGRPKLMTFYGRRVARIVPMACFVIVVALILEWMLVGYSKSHAAAGAGRWAALFAANFHTDFLFGPYWSLAVEEQFYLVYPVLVIAIVRAMPNSPFRIKLGTVLAVITVASLVWCSRHPAAAYDAPWGRAWELAVGSLVAVATRWLERVPKTASAVTTWLGLSLLVAVGLTLHFRPGQYPGTIAIIPVSATVLIIAGGAAAPRAGAEALLQLFPFKWLGRWSYSLYLWHWPIILIASLRWGVLGVGWRYLLVGIAIILSALSYATIENPIRRSEYLKRSPGTCLVGGAIIATLCIAITLAF